MARDGKGRLVWDWPLRLWHWLFALCILGAWISGEWGGFDWRQWHLWFGQAAVGLLIFRLAWGLCGPRHARFASFLPGPRRLLAYLKTLPQRNAPASAGHNPLGALAVLALLVILAVQVGTGLFISDDILYEGPWFVAVSEATADFASRIHHQLAWPIGALIALHLIAIGFYRIYKRQDLTRAMITGRKPADQVPESASIPGSRTLLALVLIVLIALFSWWLLALAPPEPPPTMDFW
ncbi:cytochrome b/b6 domain-containing protein [Wenzhouxiangella marina]|uniref:Prokaryotic cytochrome b561 n=1 Tax=Wenzhouxiangella marina TaxID=1579979 RepID=A0A0K0XSZ7_9GAMM|nr:cytochrome b/b6 domain-containing protein [Wenzhouxiangella marina]AKS40839.1 Prokaryotic cytochrome b561 [Wenzhouxiangella marina]MBB6087713.1 cytochrome b [Wenzhouxiangella marina]